MLNKFLKKKNYNFYINWSKSNSWAHFNLLLKDLPPSSELLIHTNEKHATCN
jgi:hypothetical protein